MFTTTFQYLCSYYHCTFIINTSNMNSRKKSLVSFSLVLCLFFLIAVSCTTSNPPVNAYTGATSKTVKK